MPALLRLLALGISKVFSKPFGIATATFFGRMASRDGETVTDPQAT